MKKILTLGLSLAFFVVCLVSFSSKKRSKRSQQAITKKVNLVQFPQPKLQDVFFPNHSKRLLSNAILEYFNNAIDKRKIIGASVAIVKCDSIIYSEGFGRRNANKKDRIDDQTIFRIGSISKGFAGILAGIHVQEGLINWQDKIVDHIPNFTLADSKQVHEVTLSHVLSHTSGLPYHSFTNLIEDGLSLTTIAGRFNEVLPLQKPGNFYNYQNAIFALSGEIIERVTQKPLKEVIQERIFNPLQMTTASASYEALQQLDNVALPHMQLRYGWRPLPINKKYYNAAAAGGINASATDMGKWMKFLLGNNPDVLMSSTMETIFSPKVQVGGRRNYYQRWPGYKASYYGLGWRVHEFQDKETKEINKVIHHGGGVNNYRSEIAIFPNEDLGICVLFNSPNKMAKDCIPKIHEMVKQALEALPSKRDYLTEAIVML